MRPSPIALKALRGAARENLGRFNKPLATLSSTLFGSWPTSSPRRFSTAMISSGVAPALSAPWMCRRVPGAYMCVMEASKAMLINSKNLGVNSRSYKRWQTEGKEFIGPAGDRS